MKTIYSLVTPLFFLCTLNLTGQNLVVNPGFEDLNKPARPEHVCSYTGMPGGFGAKLKGWHTFQGLTPDLIINDEKVLNCHFPNARTGRNMVGIILYHPKDDTGYEEDFHEFIQGKLKQPLVKGERYEFSLWISQSDKTAVHHLKKVYNPEYPIFPLACNNLGVMFLTTPFGERENIQYATSTFGMKPQLVFKEVIITEDEKWIQLKMSFVANNAYKYFCMGNFSTDFRTDVMPDNYDEIPPFSVDNKGNEHRAKRIAYYCIDDVSVTRVVSMEDALEKQKIYTFKNVNFETGKAVLLPDAQDELNALAAWLTDNPEKRIKICGHTDDVGNAEDNQQLSNDRAAAVLNYLTSKNISNNRMEFQGFGETQPKASNSTAEGRRINRRVECEVLN